MKIVSTYLCLFPLVVRGFVVVDSPQRTCRLAVTSLDATVDRKDFVKTMSVATVGVLGLGEPAFATGRATLEQSYERYAPRIKAGGAFYQGDFKGMVARGDWEAIKGATGNVPERQKEDLSVC